MIAWMIFYTYPLEKHSIYYLEKFFGPSRAPQYTYEQLYEHAKNITQHRNTLVSVYQTLCACLFLTIGVILFLWERKTQKTCHL